MPKPLRLLMALFAVLGLSALAACGDDDDAATDTTEEDTRDPEAGDDGGEDEEGAPEENPCAEGADVDFGEGEEPAEGATPVTVTATEYQFAGGEALGTQGEYALTLQNDGQEMHEAQIVRLAEGEVRPIEEIIAAEEEPELTEVAFAFACPGESAEPIAADIDAPGRYVMVCFVPVGALPTTPPEQFDSLGPPHAAEGMVVEFNVS